MPANRTPVQLANAMQSLAANNLFDADWFVGYSVLGENKEKAHGQYNQRRNQERPGT